MKGRRMSDHDSTPDPVDKAYAEAEAILNDEHARAVRRAQVLAAVAREPATAPTPASSRRRPMLRPGRWLAAACVTGLSLFVAVRLYQPPASLPPAAPSAAQPASALGRTGPTIASTIAPAASPAAPEPRAFSRPARSAAPAPTAALPLPPVAMPSPPPPPPPISAPNAGDSSAPGAYAATPDAPADEKRSTVVTAMRRSALAAAPAPPAAPVGLPPDGGARLRAAAAAGRTADLEALLAEGVPVGAPDADGETALMKSIRTNHPAAALLLRRHGASLDDRNHAGESARDMATAKGDAALDRALGLPPR